MKKNTIWPRKLSGKAPQKPDAPKTRVRGRTLSRMSRYGGLTLPKPVDRHWEEAGVRPPWSCIVFYLNCHIYRRGLTCLVMYSLRKKSTRYLVIPDPFWALFEN